ncbi:MAG: hypothetical protein GY802_07245 [Gammaproteobacteria bacterium]|nr:hypothetical protein [Gammaproteobacteria bacterium]
MNKGLRLLFVLLLLVVSVPTPALELFGVVLETSSRDELRAATRDAGLVLLREGGEDNWFDVYDSSTVLGGSTRFYLGFVKQDLRFAFAEYEFRGLNRKQLLHHLKRKYGKAEVRGGRYVSDRSYHWQRDGIRIELSSDWQNYKTRLTYLIPQNMSDLLAERSAYNSQQQAEIEQVSLY